MEYSCPIVHPFKVGRFTTIIFFSKLKNSFLVNFDNVSLVNSDIHEFFDNYVGPRSTPVKSNLLINEHLK